MCINSCWEIYGGVDPAHLPSSGTNYHVDIRRGPKQTYPWISQWDEDEGGNRTCFGSNITESHSAIMQTLLWNISL